jgi:hypothetical protein
MLKSRPTKSIGKKRRRIAILERAATCGNLAKQVTITDNYESFPYGKVRIEAMRGEC